MMDWRTTRVFLAYWSGRAGRLFPAATREEKNTPPMFPIPQVRRFVSVTTRFLWLFASLFLAIGRTQAQSNLVLYVSQPGDYIGQGQTYVTTNTAEFGVSGPPSAISVGAFGFGFYFVGQGGSNLNVGSYPSTSRPPFNPATPGLDISGWGRGCNTECGSFQILELNTGTNGQVDRLWIKFTNQCECAMAPETGEIRYHSLLAPAGPPTKVIRVPADAPTIQAAITNTSLLGGDTVLVSPGIYNESIDFKGRQITVQSTGGAAVTIISPPPGATAVNFSSGETSNAILSGFMVTNATIGVNISSTSPAVTSNIIVNCGTGINSGFASPAISHNQILGCSGVAIALGGAASPLIEHNIIRTNHGGISMFAAGSPTIRNNLFQGNLGDVMGMVNQSDADIIQNVIVGNTGNGITWLVPAGARGPWVVNNVIVNNGGAAIAADGYDANALIVNNILVGNPALSVGSFNDNNPPIVQFNDVYSATGAAYAGAISNLTGVDGNISVDPLFTCLPDDDFHLLAGSPCIDAGTNGLGQIPNTDFDGNSRTRAGLTNGTARVDLGAYEFNPAVPPVPCLYVICPSNIVVTAAAGQNSATVTYPAPTGPPVATITSVPPSGSVFPGGTNVVTCTASYGSNSVSSTFTITVLVPPTIANQSPSTNVLAGRSLSLSVTPAGTPPFAYSWLFENAKIGGALSATVLITNVQAANEGIYRAVVANAVGTVTGAVVSVRVLPSAPLIVANPVSLSLSASTNATFSVSAVGSQLLSYQWFFNGTPIVGATTAQLSLRNIQSRDSGDYLVVLANSLGTVTSTVATLTVAPRAPYFVTQPASASVSAGSSRTFSGLANGTEPIGYQWLHNGMSLPGDTQSSLALANVTLADAGSYSLVASNVVGVSTSAVAQLTVYQTPTLVQGLTNQVVDSHRTVLLAISALGSPTLTYTWQWNGQPLDASGPQLTLTNVQPTQAGYYRVTVSNQYGSAFSTARLSVLGQPGEVVAWGDDSGGQTHVPVGLKDAVAVAGGDYHSVALLRNGSLTAWGYDGDGQTNVPTSGLRFVSLAAGAAHNLAITEKGAVVAWGRNEAGQSTVPSSVSDGVLAVAAGEAHSLALLATGTVVAWGDNSFGQISVPPGLNSVRAIAAGRNHSLALKANGAVVGWGFNMAGQATPPSLSNAVAVTAGYLHSVALLANGTVVAWGDNTFGQTNVPPGLSNAVAVAAGDFHTLALRADGTVLGWGDNRYQQTEVPSGLMQVSSVACGYYHGLAIRPSLSLLQVRLDAAGVVLQWTGTGTLQWAPTALGPYQDLNYQGSAYTNQDRSLPMKFFRLRD